KQKEGQLTNEYKERERDLKATEERLVRKEELLDKRQTNLDSEQESLSKKSEDLQHAKEEAQSVIREQQDKLEKIAGLTADEAKTDLIKSVEKQYEGDLEGRMRKLEISSDQKLE